MIPNASAERRRHANPNSGAGTPVAVRTPMAVSQTHHSDITSVAQRTRASSVRTHNSAPAAIPTVSQLSTPMSRSSSEPSPQILRRGAIEAALEDTEEASSVGVEARATSAKIRQGSPKKVRKAPSSTPSGNASSTRSRPRSERSRPKPLVRTRSPSPASSTSSIYITSHHPIRNKTGSSNKSNQPVHADAIVMDPSWLDDYTDNPPSPSTDSSSVVLSPLNSDDIPLRPLRSQDAHSASSATPNRPRSLAGTPSLAATIASISAPSTPRSRRKMSNETTPKRVQGSPVPSQGTPMSIKTSPTKSRSIYYESANSSPVSTATSSSSPTGQRVRSPTSVSSRSPGDFSTIYARSPAPPVPVPRIVEHREDPRSPILDDSYVPEITFLR